MAIEKIHVYRIEYTYFFKEEIQVINLAVNSIAQIPAQLNEKHRDKYRQQKQDANIFIRSVTLVVRDIEVQGC